MRNPPAAVPLVGRWADFFVMGLGATLVIPVVIWASMRVAPLAIHWIALTFVVAPHYAATYRRAYRSLDAVRKDVIGTVLAPAVLLAASVAALRSPERFAPWFFLAFLFWTGWHYSRQSLGIALAYFLRQGHPLDRGERLLFALPLYASWMLWLAGLLNPRVAPRNDVFATARIAFPVLNVGTPVVVACAALLALSLGGTIVLVVRRRRRGAPVPMACLSLILTQAMWFSVSLANPIFSIVTVPLLHSLQYLGFAGWHHQKTNGSLVVYALTLLAIGVVMREVAPRALIGLGYSPLLVGNVVATFINLHHFVLDARIWRLRDPQVAEPLLQPALVSQSAKI